MRKTLNEKLKCICYTIILERFPRSLKSVHLCRLYRFVLWCFGFILGVDANVFFYIT